MILDVLIEEFAVKNKKKSGWLIQITLYEAKSIHMMVIYCTDVWDIKFGLYTLTTLSQLNPIVLIIMNAFTIIWS